MDAAQLNKTLIDAFPELKEQFKEYVSWQDGMDTGYFLTYEDLLLPVARRALEQADGAMLKRIGDFIEMLMTSGDPNAKNVATVGLIEGLRANGDDGIREHLGPVAREEYDTLVY